ncbi:MAG: deoxyguanosinetriphosphate triphosphohydrolase [Alphaproteobacteria bacterium]|nr:deoxyguanosinetriphosphate triphosphohydrolase [Alphaproteobacteria bacterium]
MYNLVSYASFADHSRGRLYSESESSFRSVFQRDRDRIIHSGAFRRLQYKTQVFVYHEGDYYRTRLTHSLEVAQIARTISQILNLNQDLAEALALAHDFGHSPFGHAGEEALAEVMQPYDGFNHNVQTFRIVTELEQKYAEFDGLNLTWETLEGIVKHNGPIITEQKNLSLYYTDTSFKSVIAYSQEKQDLELDTWPSLEAQIAALADDIAYNNHDLDDGLRAGLFDIQDLYQVPWIAKVLDEIIKTYPNLERARFIHELIRRLIHLMVTDLIDESKYRLSQLNPLSISDIRNAKISLINFSEEMNENQILLKRFLFNHMYRHYKVNRMSTKAKVVVKDLFDLYFNKPECLPSDWQKKCDHSKTFLTARVVTDYIAGMTDRYALKEHQRFFDLYS